MKSLSLTLLTLGLSVPSLCAAPASPNANEHSLAHTNVNAANAPGNVPTNVQPTELPEHTVLE